MSETSHTVKVKNADNYDKALEAIEMLGLYPTHFHFGGAWKTAEGEPFYPDGLFPIQGIEGIYFLTVDDGEEVKARPVKGGDTENGYVRITFDSEKR